MLDYLELLESGSNARRLKELGWIGTTLDWSGAGMELRWIGAAEIAWRVASDARKDSATAGVSFLSARVCLC